MPLALVDEQNFEQEVLQSPIPVLVEFGAEWCGPCKTVAPELEALQQELSGKAKIVTVDIDRSPTLAQQLGIQSVPTFVIFHEGRPAGGKVGALRQAQLREMLEPLLPRDAGALKPEEVFKLQQAGRISLVDTREPAVWKRSRIAHSVNLPLDDMETRLEELQKLPEPPVLYCRAGTETKDLAARLAGQGFPVSYLEGGVLAWEGAGFELERPD